MVLCGSPLSEAVPVNLVAPVLLSIKTLFGVDEREADSHGDVDGQAHGKSERLARADNQESSGLYDIHMDAAQPAGKQEENRHGNSPGKTCRQQQ